MKQLFLSSSFQDVATLLPAFAQNSLQGKRVTFIPTAALHEKVNFFVKSGKKALERLGLIVDVLELTSATTAELTAKLTQNDLIYLSGGNTFFLLQELQRTGADKLISDAVQQGKLYIGESAGSIVTAPDIGYVQAMDSSAAAQDLTNYGALSLVDFYTLPHQDSFPFQKTVRQIIAQYENLLPLQPITNKQAIAVSGDDMRILAL